MLPLCLRLALVCELRELGPRQHQGHVFPWPRGRRLSLLLWARCERLRSSLLRRLNQELEASLGNLERLSQNKNKRVGEGSSGVAPGALESVPSWGTHCVPLKDLSKGP